MRPCNWAPLRDRDPVPGDPDETARLARRYQDTAREIETQCAALARFGEDSSGAWDSDAGRVFAEHARELSADVGRARERYSATGVVLSSWVLVLAEIQQEADAALAAAKDAEARAAANLPLAVAPYRSALPELVSPDSPAGMDASRRRVALEEAEADLVRARRRLADAEERYRVESARLAARIRGAADSDGLKDSRWDRFKGWVADRATVFRFVAETAAAIGFVAAALSLVLGWVPILGQVLIAVAVVATAVSLIANTILAAADQGSRLAVGLDVIALASFGAAGLIIRPLARSRAGSVVLTGTARAKDLPINKHSI